MNSKQVLLSLCTLMFVTQADATTVYFNSNFNSAIDTGSSIMDSGKQLQKTFGDVTLGTFGSFIDRAMVFNPNSDPYEQVSLAMNEHVNKIFHIEFDLESQNLIGSNYGFTMHVDTPQVQNLDFKNCCFNTINMWPSGGSLGTFTDNMMMHVNVDIDLIQGLWSADVSGVGSQTGAFTSSGGGIESLRFGLAPALGGAGIDTNVYVGMDNLIVTSTVPLPGAAWLFGTGLLGIFGIAKRKRVHSQ